MDEFKIAIDTFLTKQLENANIPVKDKFKLKYEMQQDIELEVERALNQANRYINGEISKYGILI